MDTKSKVLLWVLCILLVLSVSATFYKTVVLEDVEYYESEEESDDTEGVEGEESDEMTDAVDDEGSLLPENMGEVIDETTGNEIIE